MSPWRKTFYATWAGQVCSITGFFFIMPLLPLYIKELSAKSGGMTQAELAIWAGIISSATALTMAFFQPIWGALADRYGRKPMVLRSMIGGAVVLLLMAHARNVTDLLICRMLQGCLTGTMTASVALVSSVTPERRSGYALGMMSAAMFSGAAVGPVMGGLLAEYLGFYVTFWVAASIVLLGVFLVARFAREEFTPQPRTEEGRLAPFRQIFATTGFLAALFVLFQMRFANSVYQPVYALFVEELHGQEAGARAWAGCIAGSAGMAAAISAGLLFGYLVRRWGHKRLLVYSTLGSGLVMLPLAAADHIWQLFLFRVLFGFVVAGTTPCANVIVRRIIHEKHLGKAYGLTASISCLGWGAGPLVGGFVGAAAGLRAPFVLAGALLILTAFAVALLLKVPDHPAPDQ